MRLFVAFRVPSAPLLLLQEKLIFEGVKLTHDFHCTLKFLGEVPEEKISKIIERLHTISFSAFPAHFSDVGVFPALNNPRVVWVGLEPGKQIVALQQQIEHVLEGMFSPGEQFVPHVTLGRAKFLRERERFREVIHTLKIRQEEFSVDSFVLLRSELKGTGPEYHIVEEFVMGR